MYKKEILKNKVRLITEYIPHVRSAAVGIWVTTGTQNEEEKNQGISHFIEHMMFKGTKRRTAKEIARTIESVGGSLNAATNKEYTLFYARILSEHLILSLDLLTDMILNSLFSEEEIDKEKKVVLEEIKMYEDEPSELVHDLFVQTIFGKNSLGRNILGTSETVAALTQKDILKYVEEHYRANNIIITVAGHLNHQEIKDYLIKVTDKLPEGGKNKQTGRISFKPSVEIRPKDTEQVHFCLGTRGYSQTHPDKYTLTVLDAILGGGMSSRLFQEIREKQGLVYSIYTFQHSYKNTGLFSIYAGCSPSNFSQTIQLIIKELKKIREKGISNQELKRTKEQLKGNLMLSLESTSNRMSKLGRSEIYLGRELTLDEIISKINEVKKDDIIRVANNILTEDHLTLTALGPLKNEEKIKKELEEMIRGGYSQK